MFEEFAKHKAILVTGPQRAGTRIATKMIAADTGHRYVDEIDIAFRRWDLVLELAAGEEPVVIQAPGLSHMAEHFPGLVVFMMRPVAEIEASQKRIGWNPASEYTERGNYDKMPTLTWDGQHENRISAIKYTHWLDYQSNLTKNYVEVWHHDLSKHRLWVDADKRRDFAAGQTEIGGPDAGPTLI